MSCRLFPRPRTISFNNQKNLRCFSYADQGNQPPKKIFKFSRRNKKQENDDGEQKKRFERNDISKLNNERRQGLFAQK